MEVINTTLGAQLKEVLKIGDNGVHKAFIRFGDMAIVSFGKLNDKATALIGSLRNSHLLPFQLEAVSNIVYRPSTICATLSKQIRVGYVIQGRRSEVKSRAVFENALDDIGAIVINDLITGSGKTLVSSVGALLFARERISEVDNQYEKLIREQKTHAFMSGANVPTRLQCSPSVVIFCGKTLTIQWKTAVNEAAKILGYSNLKISVDGNGGEIPSGVDV